MAKINSKKKGATGEREFSKLCKAEGFENVRRTQQYCGNTGDASDCVGLEGIHIEVKRVERLNIEDAMAQAKHDCKGDNIPIVAHRKNNCKWKITMDAEDWFKLYREWVVSYE